MKKKGSLAVPFRRSSLVPSVEASKLKDGNPKMRIKTSKRVSFKVIGFRSP